MFMQKIIIALLLATMVKIAAVLIMLDDPEDAMRRLLFAFAMWWFIEVEE